MDIGWRLAFLLLLVGGLGQSAWPAVVALVLRWLLGDSICLVLLGLALLGWPWLGPWMPPWLSVAAVAITLALLPAQPPPALRWLPADLNYTFSILCLGLKTWVRLNRRRPDTFVDSFERWARAQPGRTILVWTGPGSQSVTFRELDAQACRAAWAMRAELGGALGLHAREPTALLMLPSQTMAALALWLGLAKLGCPVAWINPHSRGAPLVHAVLSSGAQVLIVDPGEDHRDQRRSEGVGTGTGDRRGGLLFRGSWWGLDKGSVHPIHPHRQLGSKLSYWEVILWAPVLFFLHHGHCNLLCPKKLIMGLFRA